MAPKKQAVSKPRLPQKHPRELDVPDLPWALRDEAMRRRYDMLSRRAVVCTRYVDTESMSHLGIVEVIDSFAQSVGWSFFLSLRAPTLIELTLEFLSSLECDFNALEDNEAPSIKFRLLGHEFALSIRRLNALFEFPNSGEPTIPVNFCPREAWRALSGSANYNPSSSKATQLIHPATKYIHRFMAHSIFGRGESTGVVNKRELFILWAMIHEGRIKINSAHWMLNHMLSVARHDTGAIVVGGLVSMIAMRLGIGLEAPVHTRVLGNDRLDLNTLVLMRMCRREGGKYVIITEAGEYQPRPPVAVDETIPRATDEASTSHQHPAQAAVPSSDEANQSTSLMQQILTEIRSLASEVRDVREAQRSMQFKLASIEIQLQSLNDVMNTASDGDGDAS